MRMNFPILSSRLAALASLAALAACGGGSASPTVANVLASNVAYGKTLTVSVSGNGLNGGITVSAEPGCGPMTAATGGTDTLQTFTCKITTLGSVQPRVRNADGREIATVRLDVPTPQVTMKLKQGTDTGTIVIELDPASAPKTVDNFLAYVSGTSPFLANTLFHRVIGGVLIQAGGYTTGLTPKTSGMLAPIELESNNGLKNLRGTIGAARLAEPNTATSQFYINLQDNPAFDYVDASNPGYAVFGKVVTGQDVADFVGNTMVGQKVVSGSSPAVTLDNVPLTEIVITSISQTR